MRIIFAGTPAYAVPPLEALLDSNRDVRMVVTPPDRVSGRGQSTDASPIKKNAVEHGLTVFQPNSINEDDAVDRLAQEEPDLLVVASFGKILSRAVLEVPKKAAINIHPSLLPKYRGPSPVAQAILDGKEVTGVTIFEMDEKMDHGPLVRQVEVPIGTDETTGQLRRRLFQQSADMLPEVLQAYDEGRVEPMEQDHDQATYTSFFSKEDGRINWRSSAQEIYRRMRALKPWPNTFSMLDMESRTSALRIVIHEGRPVSGDENAAPGTITDVSGEGLTVETGGGLFSITELQPANGRAMSTVDFINGYQPQEGDRFLNP